MHVVFRADASIEMGTGHVMRCLTLATALREQDVICVFICRPLKGNLIEYIEDQGFTVLTLSEPTKPSPNDMDSTQADAPSHSAWLGVDWRQDADDSLKVMSEYFGERTFDWLIIDHYALDSRWEKRFRPICTQLMVIDDLADRTHDCDVLLDQNLGRTSKDYAELLPANATTLIGPRYALLRPEFANLRAESLARRNEEMTLQRILVTMGGMDKDNATTHVLDALDASTLSKYVRITVVMGVQAPWLESVRERAERMRLQTEVLVGVNDMARLMSDSDLAIGAAGSTTWERCCLGLPTLIMTIADNQIPAARALDGVEAGYYLGDIRNSTWQLVLTNVLERCISKLKWLYTTSMAATAVCDGEGTSRMVNNILLDLEDTSSDLRSKRVF